MKRRRVAAITKAWDCDEMRAAAKARAEQQFEDNERRRKFIEASHSPEALRKQTEARRKMWADPEYRARRVAFNQTPEMCKSISRGQAAAWADPVKRAKRIAALAAARERRKAAS